MLENAERFTNDITFVGIASGADESFDHISKGWRQGDGHGEILLGRWGVVEEEVHRFPCND